MRLRSTVVFFILVLTASTLKAQYLITTSNKCYKQIQEGNALNDAQHYQEAFDAFEKVLKDCSAKDAKEEGNLGLAIAANGLKRYDIAIEYANAAIKRSKNKNVMAFYARSYAYEQIGELEAARQDAKTITDLTTKNKNVKSRATIFAHLAHLDAQLNRTVEADSNLQRAIELDPTNPAFYILKGDWNIQQRNYTEAFKAYDRVLEVGKTDLEIYQIRTEARLKQYQEKYNTHDSNVLARVMTSSEKTLLCREMQKAIELGLRNMQLELLSSLICE